MKRLRLALLLAVATPAAAQYESDFRRLLCDGMRQEATLPAGTRADCLGERHAIEVDYSHKWHEAIGQALHYAAETGLEPGIILVCRLPAEHCLRHKLLALGTIRFWKLPVHVWLCELPASSLDACEHIPPASP